MTEWNNKLYAHYPRRRLVKSEYKLACVLKKHDTLSTDSSHNSLIQFKQSSEKLGRWTKEEHNKFLQAIKLYGRDWKQF